MFIIHDIFTFCWLSLSSFPSCTLPLQRGSRKSTKDELSTGRCDLIYQQDHKCFSLKSPFDIAGTFCAVILVLLSYIMPEWMSNDVTNDVSELTSRPVEASPPSGQGRPPFYMETWITLLLPFFSQTEKNTQFLRDRVKMRIRQ